MKDFPEICTRSGHGARPAIAAIIHSTPRFRWLWFSKPQFTHRWFGIGNPCMIYLHNVMFINDDNETVVRGIREALSFY